MQNAPTLLSYPARLLAICSTALLLFGCALSPQQISLQPEIVVEPRDYGHQHGIIVETVDKRANDILGVRGGVYKDTSIIQLENAFSKAITTEVMTTLTSWGFAPVEKSSQKLPLFTLSIDDIAYETNDRKVANKVTTTIKASLEVSWGSKRYTGQYSAAQSSTFVKTPSERANTKLVNSLASAVLQQVFDDPGLAAFLQEQADSINPP